MDISRITGWLDRTLKVADFDDVSNNGVQIAGSGRDVTVAAVAVDASVRAVEEAASAGAGLLVVHHGISWGGGVRRLVGGVYSVVKAAIEADLALYACHLPLDAHPSLGNNARLAKLLGLSRVRRAFCYHGNVIGLVGENAHRRMVTIGGRDFEIPRGRIGVCSGGAGEFAEEAKALGCDLFLTGEAGWGDVVAAENCGMRMICAGHYETEVFGVRAVAAAARRALKIKIVDLTAKTPSGK
ncbi:MAG: Nif3-like dinuclear metal center hexameric protein [Kiritimatiellae bacterium]|nr:Nif3-like dinuclear metal center hexameric protein [Kiritimatiellia bacterium]